jgi:hypothetical protein
MKRATLFWLITTGVLTAVVGAEIVWALNVVSKPAQQRRQELLNEKEASVPRAGPELLLSPPIAKLKPAENQNVDIILKAAGEPIIGVDLVLKFDPKIIAAVDAVPGQPGIQLAARESKLTVIKNEVDNQNGEVIFSALTAPGQTISARSVLATMIIKAKRPGKTKLYFKYKPGFTTDTNATTAASGDVLDRTLGAEYVVKGNN